MSTYPTVEQVNAADQRQLLSWTRFLPSPSDDAQIEVLNVAMDRQAELREANPAEFVAASKSLGW